MGAMGAMAAGQWRGAGALVRIVATATCCSAAASEQQEDRELPASVHSVFAHGAVGDGKANETAAIQRTIEAAAATGPGSVVLLPHNGTFRLGGGVHMLGHHYDGVVLQVDGNVTVPDPSWSTPAQCGFANASAATAGFPNSLCSVLTVINVRGFRFRGHGSFVGYLFDEHKCAPTKTVPKPCPPSGFFMVNCTDLIVQDLFLAHFPGMVFIHNSQDVLVKNLTMINRDNPEETGDIECVRRSEAGLPACRLRRLLPPS